MGSTFEIEVWKKTESGWHDGRGDQYGYEQFWRGESWIAAAWNYIKAKRQGHGCVTLHWR